jgi:hypothetical protein
LYCPTIEENHRIRGESEQESPYSWFEKQAAQLALAGEQLASLELAKGLPTTAESRLGFPIEWNRQFQVRMNAGRGVCCSIA